MNILNLICWLMLCCSLCACSPEISEKTRRYETAYFRKFEIRTDPIRVFDEIPKEHVLSGRENRYLEATFDHRGLIERLRLIAGANIVWEARYRFHDTKKIASESWTEAGATRIRLMSDAGVVTNEIHAITEDDKQH